MTTLLLGDGAPDRTELIARTREWVEASPRLSAVRGRLEGHVRVSPPAEPAGEPSLWAWAAEVHATPLTLPWQLDISAELPDGRFAACLRTTRSPVSTDEAPGAWRLAWTRLPVSELREIADVLGGSPEDAYLGVVAGAARRWHGDDPPSERARLTARLASLSPPRTVDLPVGARSAIERHALVRALSSRDREATDLVLLDATGPRARQHALGRPVHDMFLIAPPAAGTLTLSSLTYHGKLEVAAAGDARALPDGQRFVAAMQSALTELLALARGEAEAPASASLYLAAPRRVAVPA